jgi:UDP-2,3-diacylglucosamine pyrophosphatase LpxH
MGKGPYLSDGERNYLEDFFYDQKFAEFLAYYSSGDYEKAEVELVINGDFFNHLQVDPRELYPELITDRVAVARTGAIIEGHPAVFEGLRKFVAAPNHNIVFMIGNHDLGLFYPSVQRQVVDRIGGETRVHNMPQYVTNGVVFEHGNQQVAENWVDFQNPFVTKDVSEPIINLPWGDLFVIRFLNQVKRARPYIDKVFPFKQYLKWALLHDTLFALKASAFGLWYFLQVFLGIGENKKFRDRKMFRIVKEFSFPVKMHRAAKRVITSHPECRIVIFGHGHRPAHRQFKDGREYINTGIWNEMISFDVGSFGRTLRFTFAEIRYKDGTPHGELKEWKGCYREVEDVVLA